MQRILFLLLAIATNLAAATQCRSDVLLYESAPNGSLLELTSPNTIGNSFENTLGAGAKVTSVTIWLQKLQAATGLFQVKLWDTGGTSGNYTRGTSNLGTGIYSGADTLNASVLTTTLTAYTFTFNPGTTSSMAANGVYMWEITTTVGTSGAIYTQLGSDGTGTSSMDMISNGYANGPYLLSGTVYATVPEPGTLLLGGIAAACGGGGVWWKRRRRPVKKQPPAETIAN
jgi:hypothetical protein